MVTANHYWLDGLVAIALAIPLLALFGARGNDRRAAADPRRDRRPETVHAISGQCATKVNDLLRFVDWVDSRVNR